MVTMRGVSENLVNRIAKIPMAMVIIPFAMGIFFADMVQIPVWLLFLACLVTLIGVITLSKWWQNR